jgi:predicted alpha/beta superfamily hydrolase
LPAEGELRYHAAFPSRLLNNQRPLVVYLPPGYNAEKTRRYPVLYMHDGQNLFDAPTAAFGVAWDAGRTADRLIAAERLTPLLIVGIYNTPDRMDEYTIHYDPGEGHGGKGRLYGRFVLEEVKPFIDSQYRTLPGRDTTAVAGSSLGGLVSLTMARDHGEQFALCGALSPSIWWRKGQLLQELEVERDWLRRMRFWVDMGTREGRRRGALTPLLERMRVLVGHFDGAGLLPGRDYYYQEVAAGEHNEASWAARFDKVLLYFFGQHPGGRPPARASRPGVW